MNFLSVAAWAAFILAGLVTNPVAAQEPGLAPHAEAHGINPSLSVTAPTDSPLQDQMRQDYATSLMGAQRELMQQNPSGWGARSRRSVAS